MLRILTKRQHVVNSVLLFFFGQIAVYCLYTFCASHIHALWLLKGLKQLLIFVIAWKCQIFCFININKNTQCTRKVSIPIECILKMRCAELKPELSNLVSRCWSNVKCVARSLVGTKAVNVLTEQYGIALRFMSCIRTKTNNNRIEWHRQMNEKGEKTLSFTHSVVKQTTNTRFGRRKEKKNPSKHSAYIVVLLH